MLTLTIKPLTINHLDWFPFKLVTAAQPKARKAESSDCIYSGEVVNFHCSKQLFVVAKSEHNSHVNGVNLLNYARKAQNRLSFKEQIPCIQCQLNRISICIANSH